MTDEVFRTKIEPVEDKQPVSEIKSSPTGPISSDIEVPFNDYHKVHGKPYLVDHFKLGDTWDNPDGGFPHEIETLNTYIKDQIDDGEVANSVTAINNLIKKMEKFNNLNNEERSVVKIEVLAHYAEFLMKNKRTKNKLKNYASNT